MVFEGHRVVLALPKRGDTRGFLDATRPVLGRIE